jgi:hypothetical protein
MLVEAYVILPTNSILKFISIRLSRWHHLLKGDFLEGKRNRRLDHLIHVLTEKAIPHFIARHRRQAYGFEGPDLELRKRIKIEERAKAISIADITALDNIFRVQSHSDPHIQYEVDITSYFCTCLSFSAIRFCKHMCAVQHHFPETIHLIPTSSLSIVREPPSDEDQGVVTIPASSPSIDDGSDSDIVQEIGLKLQELANRFHFNPPKYLTETLETLHMQLDTAISESRMSSQLVLPSKQKVAPNQHSWPETAAVMGVAIKSKRKTHTDPYSGGERPGKKAKPDARIPLTNTNPAFTPVPLVTSAILPALHIPPQPFTPITSLPVAVPSAPSYYFDERSIDVQDLSKLQSLHRTQLNKLCKLYKVKAKGTNEDIIVCLHGLVQP